MKLFEITLPTTDNAGASLQTAHMLWQAHVMRIAGGYTEYPMSRGVWHDGPGKIYIDQVVPYRVACTLDQWQEIVREAFKAFPDQLAIFHAHVGTAVIEERKP
jgi:hypothetical protein